MFMDLPDKVSTSSVRPWRSASFRALRSVRCCCSSELRRIGGDGFLHISGLRFGSVDGNEDTGEQPAMFGLGEGLQRVSVFFTSCAA